MDGEPVNCSVRAWIPERFCNVEVTTEGEGRWNSLVVLIPQSTVPEALHLLIIATKCPGMFVCLACCYIHLAIVNLFACAPQVVLWPLLL